MGFIDITPELLVDLCKAMSATHRCRRTYSVVADPIPDGATVASIEISPGPNTVRIYLHDTEPRQYSPMLVAHDHEQEEYIRSIQTNRVPPT
jgi:hypothetical protein